MEQRWSKEKANAWRDSRDWIVGCNFIPSRCINHIEIWQEFEFDDVMKTVERELDLAASIGINSIRMVLPFAVWKYQHDGFLKRMDTFLDTAHKRGISLMPVLFDDCCGPKPKIKEPHFGKQPDPVPGYHGGFAVTPFDGSDRVGYHLCDDEENVPDLEAYVRDLVSRFGRDERIVVWDIWNEPGNSNRHERSLQMMVNAFAIARAENPMQPLTAGPWNFGDGYTGPYHGVAGLSKIEKLAMDLSDVISYHFYGNKEHSIRVAEELKREGRPLLITEWLHRPFANHVADLLPYFKQERIGCYHWGLVAGKTQTYEPWESIRKVPGIDLTLWQHDLFHADLTPYDEKEIELFRSLCLQDSRA